MSRGPETESLFIRRVGRSGPVVVLLHGLGASGRYWRPVAERLAPTARIVCPDLLGFGRSPRPSAAYSVTDHLTALDAALNRLSLSEPVILGGHSLGAILALEWAAARPDCFRGVALFSLPVYRSAAEARVHIAGLSPLAWATVTRPDLGELICGVMCAGRPFWRLVMPLLMPRLPSEVARDGVLHDWRSYSGSLQNVIVDHRIESSAKRLARATTSVRLVHGGHDRQAPLARVRELAGRFGWPVRMVEGRTHGLPLKAPGACADSLRALIREADTGVLGSVKPKPRRLTTNH